LGSTHRKPNASRVDRGLDLPQDCAMAAIDVIVSAHNVKLARRRMPRPDDR
jgi:hypothetical protein